MMVGGPDQAVQRLDPVFKTLAPGVGDVPRTPGRDKIGGTAEQGYLHCGPSVAGHFVKMVHNGIEYGVMAAYAEGLAVLRNANIGKQSHEINAETTPLRDPELYQYDLNLRDIAEVWRRGSVIASWLLDLTATAPVDDQGGNRRGSAGACAHHGAVRALHLARRGGFPGQIALRHALPVWRTPGETRREVTVKRRDPYERTPLRRPGLLRRHG